MVIEMLICCDFIDTAGTYREQKWQVRVQHFADAYQKYFNKIDPLNTDRSSENLLSRAA